MCVLMRSFVREQDIPDRSNTQEGRKDGSQLAQRPTGPARIRPTPPATAFARRLMPQTLSSPFVMCLVCRNAIHLVPLGQLNENIFKMRNIWSFLIVQFLLPTCVGFFSHSKNQ